MSDRAHERVGDMLSITSYSNEGFIAINNMGSDALHGNRCG